MALTDRVSWSMNYSQSLIIVSFIRLIEILVVLVKSLHFKLLLHLICRFVLMFRSIDFLNGPVNELLQWMVQFSTKYWCFVTSWFLFQERCSRNVRQYHFCTWPDMGLPDDPSVVVNFIQIIKEYNPKKAGPMIVHCRCVKEFRYSYWWRARHVGVLTVGNDQNGRL